LEKKVIRELRGKAQALDATVHVGKEGITGSIVEELTKQLKKNKLVKVRLLPSLEMDREAAADQLAKASSSALVEVRGRTVVLAKD
jgi:RNA-binding protein